MKEKTSGSLNFQILEGAFFAVIAVFIIVVSAGMNPYGSWSLAPGLFPLIMGVILLVLAISLIFQAVRSKSFKSGGFDKVDWLRITISMALTFIYVWLLPMIGFIAISIPYLALMLLLLGEKRWWLLGIISVGTTLSLYYAFGVLLSVYLP
ncbi:MAG: tripartite tricarboxylate transporter TctB family protein [Mesotoga sp.]|jgi:putative tricarboxylic transport membrane protein|uniref:tripartite tricarboxylate transporter TctB family protein n=1 Tax=unclassified Mesotoga TaxID=1184398 RepID=UPI000EF1F4A7|nr:MULTISPECIES: tripartite tricarboxylate transporter TctB family protein [unclassified Mesotoga]MDI9366805.1 tripartite tricarboxylate transporter TctB family protein [Thermotogota bacterium]NLT46591.1 tripartite tricarboxylate transporter TctB family protein [Thermotogaceae bacterium]MDD2334427.1 tripartite tricarboxylate transporter TctB family protein [Mesotoga sp.]MDD3681782.1 tripartite tricarboxylate transporter TctB family protein [Mesotoga sp.]MDD4208380.1 tripartite tricarboxylate t